MKKLLLILLLYWLNGCVNHPTTPVPLPDDTTQVPEVSVVHQPSKNSVTPSSIAVLPQQSLTELPDVWLRIRQQIQIDIPNTPEVEKQRDFYRKYQSVLKQVAVRAEPFLYHIVTELEQRQMPVELALLPIVESSFNPIAQAGAPAGLWQMVPQTAQNFGLQRNEWYDGRKDPIASTKAALDYLQYLYHQLGNDWLNAVAGFNSGEGRVQQAIARNRAQGKPIDFWSLNLPKQSTVYLPKWLALIDLLQDAEKYKVHWPAIPNSPKIGFTTVKGPVDLNQVARLSQLSFSELKMLNPGYKRSYTAQGEQALVLPLDNLALFAQNRSQLQKVKLQNTITYRVKSGDSLGLIASKHGITVAKLKQLNQLKSDQLKIGQQLIIQTIGGHAEPTMASAQLQAPKVYQVKSGDNLWLIAKAFNIDSQQLAKFNHLSPQSSLKPGQKLKIPVATRKTNRQPDTSTRVYVVKSGDSLDKIAKKQKVKLADLMKWNALTAETMLQPGQKLQLK